MYAEYFLHSRCAVRAGAWCGLVCFVAHQAFRAWVSYRLNDFYGRFYDALGESGSGEELEGLRQDVMQRLVEFVWIVVPVVVVHPVATLLRNFWLYGWRVAMVRSYLRRWCLCGDVIEGAAQRVHEDTQRFADAWHGFFALGLESLITLCLFLPVLWKIDGILFTTALCLSFGGIGVSALIGHPLVALEVNNQRVEATLRTRLVLLETDQSQLVRGGECALPQFGSVLSELYQNYSRLYMAFFAFSWWLAAYDQGTVIVPYLIAAPRLFRAKDPYTLGTLIQATNAFSKVFHSISIVSDSWAQINAFRSVYRRLRGFEAWLDTQAGAPADGVPPADAPEAELVSTTTRSDGTRHSVV